MHAPEKASTILLQAAHLVGNDRAETHGDIVACHAHVAAFWTVWLQERGLLARDMKLTAHDAAMMLGLLKAARTLEGQHNLDDARDMAGYAAVAGEIAERTRR
jgi:hypothetical protein